MLAGLHIPLTGEDTVPAEAVPVAQMTLAEGGVSPVDRPTDHDLGRFRLSSTRGAERGSIGRPFVQFELSHHHLRDRDEAPAPFIRHAASKAT